MKQQRLLLHLTSFLLASAVLQAHISSANPVNADEVDGPNNRKLLGSSVVTSVSVIMDHPNGTKTYITDAEPPERPAAVGSPVALMSPDRYEFYSFGQDGELVKKLMTLEQIQGLIAGGDELNAHVEGGQAVHFYQQPLVQAGEPEGVNKVLESVQNVLKSELQTAHVPDHVDMPPVGDDSWSILLPGFLNGDMNFKEPVRTTTKPTNTTKMPTSVPPPFAWTTPSTTTSTTVQAVKVTSPRHPITTTTSSYKPSQRPSSPITVKWPPPSQSPATTVKYSAHYTTPPPNLKNKPAAVVKKPSGTQPKPQQPTKTAGVRPTSSRPTNVTTTERPKTNATLASTYKVPNATVVNTTFKPTTTKGTTEQMKPSGIPTITHYLPIQTSVGPSEAVKTTKPAVPTKPTLKTTPKPAAKPTKPYVKPQSTTKLKTTENPSTVPTFTTQNLPAAEKLVQKQPASAVLEAASSDMISVSVSTPGPPSTLHVSSMVRPSSTTAKPSSTSKGPVISIQPNKTKSTPGPAVSKPAVTKPVVNVQKKDPVKVKLPSAPTVSPSSVATHKPVLVNSSRPLVKITQNTTSATLISTTTKSPLSSSTKYVTPQVTTQSRLPTTAIPETTTTIATQPPTTTIGGVTNTDFSTTLSNELAQAPLKIAVSLKEPEQNVFEKVPLMTTTLKDVPSLVTTLMTTEGTTEWERIANVTTGSVGTTYAATVTTSSNFGTMTSTTPEPSTVTMTGSTLVTTDAPQTTMSKVYIINNSEPQTIKIPLKTSTDKRPYESEVASTIAEWIGSRTEAASPQTTMNLSTTDVPSTITESPSSTTTFKDQVMEEGISAVANILLDDSQSVVEKNTLTERLAISETAPTTELMFATRPDMTTASRIETAVPDEPAAFREEPEDRDKTSTTRRDDSWKTTTIVPDVTMLTERDVTTTSIPEVKKSPAPTTEMKKMAVTRVELASTASSQPAKPKPIKESKLNPDSDEQPQESQVQVVSTEGTTVMMEQIKLTEKVSSTPVPVPLPSSSVKIPLQEPKVPPPAYKKPSYSNNEATPPPAIDLHPAPYESMGAEASTAFLAEDVRRFADLCNELAFRLWTALTSKGQISSRSLVMSPFAAVSLLAMVFLGARGATSGQMNEILRLDDMVTFNPHQVLQNVTDSVISSRNVGVSTAAFVRQLYSDKSKGKILDFYKERAQQYYGGHVEEVSFSTVGDVVRRRTNLLVKRQTLGKVPEYLRGSSLNLRPPLAAFSANIFQTDCESGSTDGRDGEMYFVVRPSTRQRRLVPVPAVVWRTGFSAGYEPSLDATSVCLGQDSVVSTLLILPGQQGQVAPGDGLARLEQRLIETSYRRGGWSRVLRSLLPRPGLELQVPRFSHRSVLNVTTALGRMGLKDLFSYKADLRGLNGGATELHLSDMVQVNTFSTCGEEVLGARHHIETYPASPQRTGREETPLPNYLDNEPHYEPRRPRYHFNGDDVVDGRPRTGRLPLAQPSTDPAPPRLRFDRPFLYIVRHNPSGIILHMGRFNPRLLP